MRTETVTDADVATSIADELLTTNEAPTDNQIQALGEWKESAHGLYPIFQSTCRLAESYCLLKSFRQAELVCSASRRVPNEVWLLIMGKLMPDCSIESTKIHYILSLVCHKWNHLASVLHVPHTIFNIRYSGVDASIENIHPKFDQITDAFSLRIHIPNVVDIIPADPLTYPTHFQIQHLSLSYTPIRGCFIINSLMPTSWYNLYTLKLFVPHHIDTVDTHLTFLQEATSLIDIQIEAAVHVRFSHPFTHVKRYKEHCLDPVNFLYTIHDAHTLEELDYTIREPTNDALLGITRPHVHLPNMKRFEFKLYGYTDHVNFLSDLTFPSLETLRIREENINLVAELSFFFSNPTNGGMMCLCRLSFYSTQLQKGELLRVLENLPALEDLECGDIPTPDICALRQRSPDTTSFWRHANSLTSLTIHDAFDLNSLQNLAIDHNRASSHTSHFLQPLAIKLLYQSPSKRRHLGVHHGAITPSPTDRVLRRLMAELDHVVSFCDQSLRRYAVCQMGIVKGDTVVNIVEDLERFRCPLPQYMPLQLIHSVHRLTLLDPDSIPGEKKGVYELLKRARVILDKFVIVYQLRARREYEWVAPGANCLLFHYHDANADAEYTTDGPSEYEILYGRYRAPTREEVFWPYEDCCKFRQGW